MSESRDALPRAPGLGLAWAGYLVVTLMVALLPARVALAGHQAQFAGRAWELAAFGMAADTPFGVATYVMLNVVAVALVSAITRKRPSLRALRLSAVAATTVGFLFVLWGTISASEFRLERGLYPTSFDVSMGLVDRGYVRSALGTFFLSRFLWGWLLALAGFVLLSWGFLRATDRPPARRPVREGLLGAFALGAVALSGFGLHRGSPHLSSNFANWRVVESPFPVFFRSLGTSHENVRFGYIALVEHIGLPDADRGAGAAMLGLPPVSGRRVADTAECGTHPLAEPITVPEARSDHELASLMDELSREIYAGRERVRVWHVALESMRADDIAALNPRAPAGLTPTLDGLYAAAATSEPRVIGARGMHQAGVRTSQGLAALLCGTGTMPWGLSSARDLGLPPLRCLPDVLKDAGLSLHFYYGSNPGFDNMQSFLLYHGFDHLMTERDYVEETPHRGWAVPDRIVLSQALAASEARPQNESQYNLLMTLTHHHPFDRPEGFPAEVGERVRKIVVASGQSVGADHLKRLDTLSYADFALGEMIAKLEASSTAADSVVVVGGDHSTADYFLWRDGATLSGAERQHALSHIPFLVVFPKALVASCANPTRVYELIVELNKLLAERPISQNDVPRLVLALLARSPAITHLPEADRWHTLGGQTLSPHFRVASAPDTVVLGVNSASRLFRITQAGVMVDANEPATPVFNVESARGVTPTLLPEAALLSSFMTGYARRCWEWSNIRRVK